jgi:GT2 family glycosyltransferase
MPKRTLSSIKGKVGVGLITCDRPDFFKKSYNSVKNNKNITLVVVDDSITSKANDIMEGDNVGYIKTTGKEGVACAKNLALDYLIDSECEHIFLMEDDILIKDQGIFDLYIKASEISGIKHFNYGLHGNHNLDSNGNPTIRKTVNYKEGVMIDLYPNVLGALSYYHIDTLSAVGIMDENFYNALEHVDHTYQIIKNGFHPPFRWFADVHGSNKFIEDIMPDHKNSKIRSEADFMETFRKGLETFIKKNNFSVVPGMGPQETLYSEEETLLNLKQIWKDHHQK